MTAIQSVLRFSLPPPPCPKAKHPHLLRNPISSPHLKSLRRPTTTKITASSSPTPASDRLLSSIAYFFPFFNGLQYGRFLISQYPTVLGPTLQPFLPFLSLYRSIPYASYAAFLALYMGVARNPNLSRFARFNAMQAVVLDVLLVLPMLVERIFNPGRSGLAFKALVLGNNALFLLVVCCFLYTVVYSVMGKTPYLPFIADAASRQI